MEYLERYAQNICASFPETHFVPAAIKEENHLCRFSLYHLERSDQSEVIEVKWTEIGKGSQPCKI